MSFGFYIAVVHLLPTGSLGMFYSLQVVMGFITTFGLLSLPSGVNRFVTGYVQTGRIEEARYLFRRGIMIATVITFVSLPLMVILSPSLSGWLLGTAKYSYLFELMEVDFALTALNSFIGVSLYAFRRFGKLGLLQMAYGVFRYGLGALLIVGGYSVEAIILGWIASDLFRTLAYAYYSRELLFGVSVRNDLRKVITFSLPYMIASGLVVVLQNVDSLFVLKYLGVISLGIYGTLLNAATIPKILPTSVGSSLLPALLKVEDSKGLNASVVASSMRYMSLIVLPLFGLAAAVGRPLLHIFFGDEFAAGWLAFAILLLGHGAMSLDIPVSQVLIAKKNTKILAVQQVVSSVTLALLAVILIPKLFLIGAAFAYVLARVAGFVLTGPTVYRMGLLRMDVKEYGKIVGVTLCIILPVVLFESLTSFVWWLLPAYLALGSVSGLASSKLFRLLNVDDYEALMDAVPKRFRGAAKYFWIRLSLPRP